MRIAISVVAFLSFASIAGFEIGGLAGWWVAPQWPSWFVAMLLVMMAIDMLFDMLRRIYGR